MLLYALVLAVCGAAGATVAAGSVDDADIEAAGTAAAAVVLAGWAVDAETSEPCPTFPPCDQYHVLHENLSAKRQ